MKHLTRWRPDTCQCEIDLEWDDSVPEAQRVFKQNMVKECSVHNGHDILAENRRKNDSVNKVAELHPDIKTIDVRWEFDTNRNIKLIIPKKINEQEKSTLLAALKEIHPNTELQHD